MKSIHLLAHRIKRDQVLLLSSIIRHNFEKYVPVRYIKSFKMPRSTMHELNMQRVRQKIIARSTKHSDNTDVSLQVNIICYA
jgi:hypothetical protein